MYRGTEDQYHHHNSTMADRPRRDSTPNLPTKISRKFRNIDPDDPNDKALLLVSADAACSLPFFIFPISRHE